MPASRWRSRRWRGWCARSSRRSTATTRSSTTRSWSSGSSIRASCSSTMSPRCRPADRSCCRLTARRPRWLQRPPNAAASWSTRCAPWSPRCTTRSRFGPARATGSCTSATTATRRPSARWPSPPTRSAASNRSRRSTNSPDSTSRSHCSPKPRCHTAIGRASPCAYASASPRSGCPAAATCALPPPTASRRCWRSPSGVTRSW